MLRRFRSLNSIAVTATHFAIILLIILCGDVDSLYDGNTDRGLYVLTEESFNPTVYRHIGPNRELRTESNLWIVQFYNSWCGHCIKFSPIYKALANRTQHWSAYLKLGVVNCADDLNRDLCTRFGIRQTPVLRLLTTGSHPANKGEDVEVRHSTTNLLQTVLDVMEYQRTPRELQPLPEQRVGELWASLPRSVNEVAVIVEPIGSHVGKEALLHALPNLHAIALRRAHNNNRALLDSLNVNERTTFVMFLDRLHPDEKGLVTLESLSRNSDPVAVFTNAIIRADTELTTRLRIQRRPQLGPVYGDTTSPAVRRPMQMQVHSASSFTLSVQTAVSGQDLNSAVLYSLSNEIARHNDITGREYETLKAYVTGLIKWVPVRPATLTALRILETSLRRGNGITGAEVTRLLRASNLNVDSGAIEWDHCKGSVPDRRGYPCGLWQIIHTMSVRAYEAGLLSAATVESNALAANGVLTAVIGYVEHFFSCGECSRNFMKGVASLRRNQVVVSNADAVLFLWRAHNNANRFLAGDLSEDPAHPKQQFPTLVQCLDCRNSADPQAQTIVWNEGNVLRFLREFYGAKRSAGATFVLE
ncbi:Sulfhydryl oxidase 2 [Hypsibius exemplaris]|uniref:Sulfhydryl oxidase n=1 Tax=Hypsibius exemplaris TaxID=2072580 RepID=A0A1W0XDD0_HYPEX|nr:Sulfhydryl oxidase 2 [Hypsibius exemplaris]